MDKDEKSRMPSLRVLTYSLGQLAKGTKIPVRPEKPSPSFCPLATAEQCGQFDITGNCTRCFTLEGLFVSLARCPDISFETLAPRVAEKIRDEIEKKRPAEADIRDRIQEEIIPKKVAPALAKALDVSRADFEALGPDSSDTEAGIMVATAILQERIASFDPNNLGDPIGTVIDDFIKSLRELIGPKTDPTSLV